MFEKNVLTQLIDKCNIVHKQYFSKALEVFSGILNFLMRSATNQDGLATLTLILTLAAWLLKLVYWLDHTLINLER